MKRNRSIWRTPATGARRGGSAAPLIARRDDDKPSQWPDTIRDAEATDDKIEPENYYKDDPWLEDRLGDYEEGSGTPDHRYAGARAQIEAKLTLAGARRAWELTMPAERTGPRP